LKQKLIMLVALLAAFAANAAIADYQFTKMDGTYTEITAGNVVGGTEADFGVNITLPFSFNYCGIDYTTARISENGFLQMGQAYLLGGNYNSLNNTAANRPFIAPLWDDLDARVTGSEIRYETSGTAPNRIFTVQWKNVHWYQEPGTDQNFQVKLFETSNNIQFVYGAMNAPFDQAAAISFGASIGIRNAAAGAAGNFISITPADPVIHSTTTANNIIETADYLTNGTIYSFLAMAAVPNDLAVSQLNLEPGVIYAGDVATIKVKVLNNGTAVQTNKTLTVKVNGQIISTQTIASLAVGATTELSCTWPTVAGIHPVRAEVSADDNTVNDFKVADLEALVPVEEFTDGFEGSLYGWSGLNFGAANFWGIVNPTLMNVPFAAHGGTKVALLTFNTTGNNDWLITKKLKITATNNTLEYYFKTGLSSYPESWNVRVYDNAVAKDTANYTIVERSRDVGAAVWTKKSIDLSAYTGKTVEIAIQGISVDKDYLAIDDIALVCPSGIAAALIPQSDILEQNYPNPFNPETTIGFKLNSAALVNLSVFNSKGELVQELVNGMQSVGAHSIKFNATGLNSGVYFYKLTTPEKSVTQKMVLTK